MIEQEGLRALADRILQEARQRAEGIAAAAQAQAEAAERKAREAAEAKRQEVLGQAREDAGRYRSRVESAARLEAKRRLLAKREELIARALAMAHQRLLTGLSPGERRAAVDRAVMEAATALGGGHLVVRTNPQDAASLTPDHLEELRARLAAEGVTADVAPGSPVDISGGAIVSKDGGRVIYDNSFEARLERLQFTLRGEVWQVLTSGVEIREIAPLAVESRR